MRRGLMALTLAATVAACHGGDDSAKLSHQDNKASAAIDNAVAANSTAASIDGLPVPVPSAHALAYQIPTSFVGRWGMTPGDCNPDNMADKGLLTISTDKLVFYESKGRIDDIIRHSPYDITLKLDMTGEGQSWTSTTRLVLDAASTRLIRSEASSPATYRYQRC